MVTAKKSTATKVDVVKKTVSAKSKAVAVKPEAAKKTVAKKAVAVVPAMPPVAAKEKPASKAAAKAPAKTAAAKKVTAAKAQTQKVVVTPEQRANYVQVAAFYIAERRGFAQGNPTDDWLAAETEVDRLIASGQFGG